MLEISLCNKGFVPKEESSSARAYEIYIYPSYATKGLVSGVGFVNIDQLEIALMILRRDIVKFYNVNGTFLFLFFGSSLYFKELIENFELKPFVIKDGLFVFYSNNQMYSKTDKWHVKICKSEHNLFDRYIDGLNPMLHLVTITPLNKWRKGFHKELLSWALKNGLLSKFNVSDFEKFQTPRIISASKRKSIMVRLKEFLKIEKLIYEYRIQKNLNRSLNDLARFDINLIRDICGVAKISDSKSSLKIFNNFHNLVTEKKIKERITYTEFPVRLFIDSISVSYKASLPKNTIQKVINSLSEIFDNVKQEKEGKAKRSLLYQISFDLNLFHEDYDKIPLLAMDLIDSKIEQALKAINEATQKAWHLAKKYMWVTNISIEIESPIHFRETVIEALRSTGWFIILTEEKNYSDKIKLKAEIWREYPLYKLKKVYSEMRSIIEECDSEKLDKELYDLFFPIRFLMDCSYFFTVLNEKLALRFNYSSIDQLSHKV